MSILSNELKRELLTIKPEDYTVTLIAKLFGYTCQVTEDKKFITIPPKFDVTATVHLDPHEAANKTAIDTTVGSILFNKLMIEGNIDHIIPNGFFNEEMTKKTFGKLSDIVAKELKNGTITVEKEGATFLRAYEFWGLRLVAVFAPSYTEKMILPQESVMKMKDELLNDSNMKNIQDMVKAEDKLVAEAKRVTEGDPGRVLFDSGSRGSFENDFKNMSISIGPIENPTTGKYDFIYSNYMDGIAKRDLPAAANSVVGAEYPKAIGTAKGGYLTKQMYAAFQNVVLGDPGSDCGTTEGIHIFLTESDVMDYVDQYIIGPNNTLIRLTKDNMKQFVNRNVVIRSPMYCLAPRICNKCAGERFYDIGIDAAGLTTTALSGNILNKMMKLRHSMKVTVDAVELGKLLI